MMDQAQRQGIGRFARVAMVVAASLLAGTLPGMPGIGCVGKVANNFNPCGTILNCDPVEYDLMMNSFPDWSLDPTCTIPGQCGDGIFPFDAGGTVAAPAVGGGFGF